MMSLREFRTAEGLTLSALALRLGVHFTTVGKWETGVRLPGAEHLARIDAMTGGQVRAASFVAARDAQAAQGGMARVGGPLDCGSANPSGFAEAAA